MKNQSFLVFAAMLMLAAAHATAVETARPVFAKVGVYDSRIVAYAHFWSEPASRTRDALIAAARAAQAAADANRFKELSVQLAASQRRSHLQVFSTAPAGEAIAVLEDKLPLLREELGVDKLVSRWDEASLATVPETARIDVTDRLQREFFPNPTDNQRKVIAGLKDAKPLPLAEATRLADEGKL